MSRTASARRRALIAAVGVFPLLSSLSTRAQERARVGYEYRLIEPQPVLTADRIEVVEFFWYGCPYCYQLQGPLEEWLKRKPQDVVLRRIPAIFRESWVPHARLYYTLETLGEVPRLHHAVFRAVHEERVNLNSADSTGEWVAQRGVERARWLAAYSSPEVDRKVDDSQRFTRSYQIQGTPSVVVDGRFLTSSGMTETVAGVIPILDDLIRLAREQRPAR